ncbi:MAG: right-handed parallel beta-helix repeat-containing protein [Ignavibacteriaceae bacterium]|nr:right-handed parallel beta-helix repeat-containing protein [Ignavibacteriaceae bacterium]
MQKLKPILVLLLLFFSSNVMLAGTLLEAYQSALPGMGYDKLIILHPDSVYYGGITITNEKVGIRGNGATIDLAGGSSIQVNGESVIEIDGCVIVKGSYGLHCEGEVSAYVTQCTFFGNTTGISYMSTVGTIEVYNTIISNNSQYGFACHENSYRILHYINSYANAGGDYVEFCPG